MKSKVIRKVIGLKRNARFNIWIKTLGLKMTRVMCKVSGLKRNE